MTKRETSAATNNNAGPRRMGLYQRCIAQFNEALGQEFFIEAVAIAESLIADRLESRLAHKHEQIEEKRRFSTIGKLAAELNGKKADEPGEARELYSEIRIWASGRNKVIHEIVKLAENEAPDWDDRYAQARQTAEKGMELFRKLDKVVSRLNKIPNRESTFMTEKPGINCAKELR